MHSSDSAYNLPPFPAYPSTDRFVGLGSVQDALERIERSIQARDAISVVIGPPGTGKTLISELLAVRHQNSHRVITLGETPLPDTASFLRRVLHQAGADIRNVPGGDLQLALFDHICLGDLSETRILLLIDEAQSLSPEVLETIRTLTNLTREGTPRVSVVMFGGNHLDELLIAPSMDGFRQRISTRCYLHPLNNEETGWYINQTIRNCGCDPDATITADAISAVHHACSGVPRLINQLLTHAIEFAAEKDEYLITDRIIDQSWAEVQQLPSPMVDEPEINLTSSNVEFGELDSFDTPTGSEETTEHTASTFDQDWVDTGTATTTTAPESDAYDAYDFEPDSHPATSAEYAESTEFQPNSDVESDTTHELHTEVWDADESKLHDRFEEASEFEITGSSSETGPEEHLDIEEIGSPRLQYPQLASPALPTDEAIVGNEDIVGDEDFIRDDLKCDDLHSELSEAFSKTQTNDELFGSFDEEEEIDLQTEPYRAELPPKRPAATIETILPQEIVIHREIIGISELIHITETDQIQYCDDAHQMPSKMHHDARDNSPNNITFEDAREAFEESSVDSATLDFVSAHHGNPMQFDTAEEQEDLHEPCSDRVAQDAKDEHEAEPNNDLIRLRNDDSDMLIIEDEVDIHRIDKREGSLDANHQSIDYQRMLKRMRSKN